MTTLFRRAVLQSQRSGSLVLLLVIVFQLLTLLQYHPLLPTLQPAWPLVLVLVLVLWRTVEIGWPWHREWHSLLAERRPAPGWRQRQSNKLAGSTTL